jgi:type II secretory pathway pseudopilin PulG
MNHPHQVQQFTRMVRHDRAAGFTIIELMVLLGILGVLMAMLLPALGSVRAQGRMTSEANHARQLIIGYIAYANLHQDRVLPGHPPDPGRVVGPDGQPITGVPKVVKQRYPWRLAPYLDFDVRALLHGELRRMIEQVPHGYGDANNLTYLYAVSIGPSFGLNTQWVGGSSEDGFQPPGLLPPGDPNSHLWQQLYDMNRYFVSRISQVRHPERLIVFATARSDSIPLMISNEEGQGTMAGISGDGYYRVVSPFQTEMDGGPRWTERFHRAHPPRDYGYLSFRHHHEALVAFFDGRVGTLDEFQIRDMRYWSNWATHEDWVMPLRSP